MTLQQAFIRKASGRYKRTRAISEFLQFAISICPDRLTLDDVVRWAGGFNNHDFYNTAAVEIAVGYHRNELGYTFCDGLMNDLWRAVLEGFGPGTNQVPEPFYEIYIAFDAGEYHRRPDKSDDPVAEFTNPDIAELVTRLRL
ncbi:hypothetical protein [Neorhizobium huautlense]|uniref:hypothetical protein n=1 Tax=Neorhizobium huautlense TaxID=67774 RepID=UPI000CF9353D|nr:hypothetical protein [Neorhizobium huautlense]